MIGLSAASWAVCGVVKIESTNYRMWTKRPNQLSPIKDVLIDYAIMDVVLTKKVYNYIRN